MKAKMREKMAAQEAIFKVAAKEGRGMTDQEQASFDALETEIKNLEKTIEAQAKMDARAKEHNAPVNMPHIEVVSSGGLRVFKNFGEQLLAIKNAATTGVADDRLNKLNKEFKAATGMNEGVGSEGGFAVQTDFAGGMMESAASAGNILPLVDKYDISSGADSVKWMDIDESNVSTTVFGGVQVYWAAEAAAVTASKPLLAEKELKLEKLMGLAYTTYELEQDSNFVSDLYTRAFERGIQRKLEEAIISGTGVGKPLGILNGGGSVSVAKEVGQAAATVVWENLSKMYNRALNKDQIANYVWLAHPDLAEQFDFLSFPIGVGGVPVYLSAAAVGSVATLKGRPIIETDHCSALGTVGDIVFANLNDYMMITKGGTQVDTSIHVQFLAAENAFRFIFRANGMPKKNKPLSIKNSSSTRSSFVTLATRA